MAVEGADSKAQPATPALAIRLRANELADETCSPKMALAVTHCTPQGTGPEPSVTLWPSQPHLPPSRWATVGTRYKKEEGRLHSSEFVKGRLVGELDHRHHFSTAWRVRKHFHSPNKLKINLIHHHVLRSVIYEKKK